MAKQYTIEDARRIMVVVLERLASATKWMGKDMETEYLAELREAFEFVGLPVPKFVHDGLDELVRLRIGEHGEMLSPAREPHIPSEFKG